MDKIVLIQWPTTQKYKGSIDIQKHIDESHKYIPKREEYICCLHEVHELPKSFTKFEAQEVIVCKRGRVAWLGGNIKGLVWVDNAVCINLCGIWTSVIRK